MSERVDIINSVPLASEVGGTKTEVIGEAERGLLSLWGWDAIDLVGVLSKF